MRWLPALICWIALPLVSAPALAVGCAGLQVTIRAERATAGASDDERYVQPLALAPTTCVGARGLFIDPARVAPADRVGAAARAPAFGVVAWLLGAHQFHFGTLRSDNTADETGARFAGCALAHVGARGNDLTAQVQHLEAATAPHADPHTWRVALQAGYDRCAP